MHAASSFWVEGKDISHVWRIVDTSHVDSFMDILGDLHVTPAKPIGEFLSISMIISRTIG